MFNFFSSRAFSAGLGAVILTSSILLLLIPSKSAVASASTWTGTRVVFDSGRDKDELRLDCEELGLPSDWSEYSSLVIDLKASSAQRMNLKIFSGKEEFSRILLHPYPEVWVRAALPISLLSEPPKTGIDMAAVGNRSRPGYFVSLWGPFVPLEEVRAIVFEMEKPIGNPSLEVRSIVLARSPEEDRVLSGLPVVDEFGQYRHQDWETTVSSLGELEEEWRSESLDSSPADYCEFGGYAETEGEGTGFFRVEEIEGKWWFIDPHGHLFLSAGSDVIRPKMTTRTRGRDEFFESLPPSDLLPGSQGREDLGASFLTWNLARRFGEDWFRHWADRTFERMAAWGLNTIANWSDDRLWGMQKVPYVVPMASWQTEVSYLGLPDVYSDEFLQLTEARARRQCAPRKDDPWLLGYFLANEPPFPQKAEQTVELILEGPPTSTKARLEDWLNESDTLERRREFIDRAFNRYIEITSAAVRRFDPNHLNLGMRSGGNPTEAEISAARSFDVYSVNVYDYELPRRRAQEISRLTGKPILVGEFHFGTPGRGLAASLVQVKNHEERGVAYRYYVEQAFALPEVIGTHWFQWADQPSTGRFDGENYNIGLVDVTDRPYEALVSALRETHGRLLEIHRGKEKPFAKKAEVH